MATVIRQSRAGNLPPLENGDHLDQQTFHARYEAMPEDCRAELIGGIVYMASPQKVPHSKAQQLVVRWLDEYAEATPGTEALLNNTQILGPDSEPEPDGCLFITPEYGGQVYVDEDEYLNGSPELIVEVSSSTESIDLQPQEARLPESRRARVRRAGPAHRSRCFGSSASAASTRKFRSPPTASFVRGSFPGCGSTRRPCLRSDRRRAGGPHDKGWRPPNTRLS